MTTMTTQDADDVRREKIRECKRRYMERYRLENPEKARATVKAWNDAHPEKVREWGRKRMKAWRAANPSKDRATQNKYRNNRLKRDPDFKMRAMLRTRLSQAVKRGTKQGSAVNDLGCTIEELWAHLEPKFQPGMTRENLGSVWEIDHIFPLTKANLRASKAEFLAANNWRNLQPLTPPQNNAKGDTVTPEAQKLFDCLVTEFLI
jgi:5-methylcytosine-specific restriction endonuclease McrA